MKEKNFEEAMNRLDEIVILLQKNDLKLDDAIKLFEEGLELSNFCSNKLKIFDEKIASIYQKHQIGEETHE